ncbi:MAG: transporter substrate-binding domain-containing protein [Gammaproteobacteria bacterium]|nr:transporter substrate-binding domain-containing protein [Gammaproteobacteria bacterium]
MKKIAFPIALAATILSTSLVAQTVRIGTEGAYAPYNYMDASGKIAGYEVDLGNALCAEAKLSCTFVVNEWDTIIPNLVAGNYDLIMAGMSITDERKKSISFSAEYYPVESSLFASASDAKINLSSLKGKKIGVQGATVQAGYAETHFAANNTVLSYETFDQSVADLMAGNLDVLLADGDPLKPVVKASNGELVFVGDGIRIGGGIGIGMRKGDAVLAKKMGAALETLKKNGTVDKLIKKYFKNGPFYSH